MDINGHVLRAATNGGPILMVSSDMRIVPRISIIIRTTGSTARRELFRRAAASVLSQENVDVDLVVVFNGGPFDCDLLEWAAAHPRIVHTVEERPDKALATARGRALVSGDFFGYLDDDDELLPGSLARRAEILLASPELDCVTTNGEYCTRGSVRKTFEQTQHLSSDYCASLLRHNNWMASCGMLFRTATVGQPYFEDLTEHCEWTLLAFRVASKLNVTFIDEPTFRVNDTPGSESKQRAYVDTVPDAFADMLRWTEDGRRRRQIRRAQAAAFHRAASYSRLYGDLNRAWRFHWKSMTCSVYGVVYAPYTLLFLIGYRRPVRELMAWWRPGRGAAQPDGRVNAAQLSAPLSPS